MNSGEKKLFERMKEVKLLTNERTALREVLLMKATKTTSKRSIVFSLNIFSLRFAVLAVIMFAVGAGVSKAASGTLPGDILYPIKVGIIEPIESLTNLTVSSKAAHEARLAEKRLAEASILAKKGRLDPDTQNMLYFKALRYSDNFESISSKHSGNDISLSNSASRLQAALSNHARMMEFIASTSNADRASLSSKADEIYRVSVDSQDRILNSPTDKLPEISRNRMKEIEKEYQRVIKEYQNKDFIKEEEATAREAFSELEEALMEGKKELESGNYKNTLPKLFEAQRAVHKASVLMDSALNKSKNTNRKD